MTAVGPRKARRRPAGIPASRAEASSAAGRGRPPAAGNGTVRPPAWSGAYRIGARRDSATGSWNPASNRPHRYRPVPATRKAVPPAAPHLRPRGCGPLHIGGGAGEPLGVIRQPYRTIRVRSGHNGGDLSQCPDLPVDCLVRVVQHRGRGRCLPLHLSGPGACVRPTDDGRGDRPGPGGAGAGRRHGDLG